MRVVNRYEKRYLTVVAITKKADGSNLTRRVGKYSGRPPSPQTGDGHLLTPSTDSVNHHPPARNDSQCPTQGGMHTHSDTSPHSLEAGRLSPISAPAFTSCEAMELTSLHLSSLICRMGMAAPTS